MRMSMYVCVSVSYVDVWLCVYVNAYVCDKIVQYVATNTTASLAELLSLFGTHSTSFWQNVYAKIRGKSLPTYRHYIEWLNNQTEFLVR